MANSARIWITMRNCVFVDYDILWDTVMKDLPPLIVTLDKIVGEWA